jgi:DNA polymerase-1
MNGEFNLIPKAEWIETEAQAQEAGEYLYYHARENGLGTDTETTGVHLVKDVPLLMSLSDGNRRFAFWIDQWGRSPWIHDWLLRNPEIPKVGTKIKFDMHMCANIGINLEGPLEDTLVMDWLYDENRTGRHGLKETAKDHCGLVMKEFKEIFPMRPAVRPSKKNPLGTPGETAGDAIKRVMADPIACLQGIEYAGLDAWGSVRVKMWEKEQLSSIEMFPGRTLWQHFMDTERPFTRVLYNMERRGITVCLGHLRAQSVPMQHDLEILDAEIVRLVGWPINPNSPLQLQKYFFEQMNYEPFKMTPGGASGVKKPSTDYDSLVHFRDTRGCQVATKMIKQREVAKSKSTYVDGLQSWVDQFFRIHTTLNQHVTVTGRLSSVEPNLQNIPRPDEDKFKIRSSFVAAIGKKLVIADYDQLEMKLMAHFSQDPEMIGAIRDGKDLHCYTVALMYGENYDEVAEAKHTKEKKLSLTDRMKDLLLKRQAAKNTGFGLIYGIGPMKLAAQLVELKVFDAPKTEADFKNNIKKAKALIDKYFNAFPGAKRFIDETHRRCMEVEYVQTLMGRFRRLPGINAKGGGGADGDDGGGIVAEAKRQSVNVIIQGTAADIAKQAMIVAEYDPVLVQIGALMLLQIHDELIFEVDDDDETVEICKSRVQAIMEHPFGPDFELSVKLTAAAGSGYTWVDAK